MADRFKEQANCRDDAIEAAAISFALRGDEWFVVACDAHSTGEMAMYKPAVDKACALLRQADQLLASHSYLTLDYRLDYEPPHGGSDADKEF